jgi:predicted DNA-binding transcriptional regulator AlpA
MQRNRSAPFQPQRRFVSECELEQITGIPRRTWQKHRLFKRGPRYYKIYGSIRYDLEEVVAWIKATAVGSLEHSPTEDR